MLSSPQYVKLKLSKMTSVQKLFDYGCITLYTVYFNCAVSSYIIHATDSYDISNACYDKYHNNRSNPSCMYSFPNTMIMIVMYSVTQSYANSF